MMPTRPALLLTVVLAVAVGAVAPETHEASDDALTLGQARAALIGDAKAILAGTRPMPRRAGDLPSLKIEAHPVRLGQMLLRPVDRDPFVDAYVRWRLSLRSDAAPPELDDRAFARFVRQLPPVTFNPMADPDLLQRAMQAANSDESLPPERVAEINARADAMTVEQERAFARRLAAVGLRQSLIRRAEQDRAHGRALLLRIELAVAMVKGGWTSDQAKREVGAACARAATEQLLTPAELEMVADAAQRAVGVRTPYIARARAAAGGFQVQIGETAIDDFEVRDWLRPFRR